VKRTSIRAASRASRLHSAGRRGSNWGFRRPGPSAVMGCRDLRVIDGTHMAQQPRHCGAWPRCRSALHCRSRRWVRASPHSSPRLRVAKGSRRARGPRRFSTRLRGCGGGHSRGGCCASLADQLSNASLEGEARLSRPRAARAWWPGAPYADRSWSGGRGRSLQLAVKRSRDQSPSKGL